MPVNQFGLAPWAITAFNVNGWFIQHNTVKSNL